MTEEKNRNYSLLKETALDGGASLFGACLHELRENEFTGISPDTMKKLPYAVSAGAALSGAVLDDITDHPTKLYFYHYRQVNYLLDRIALLLAKKIQDTGFSALPVPASQTIDWNKQRGALSHRKMAAKAGLGWIGRSRLLVNPELGARLRLVTVLTDMPLAEDKPLEDGCGSCMECVNACPAGAIKKNRDDYDFKKCFNKLDEFRKKHGIGHHICGVCVKVCRGNSAK